jgi:hypothetical protein
MVSNHANEPRHRRSRRITKATSSSPFKWRVFSWLSPASSNKPSGTRYWNARCKKISKNCCCVSFLDVLAWLSPLCATGSVLKEIDDTVKKRLPSHPEPVRKRDRLSTWVRRTATDVKRVKKDAEELHEMQEKLQVVVEKFTVRSSLLIDGVGVSTRTHSYLHSFETS